MTADPVKVCPDKNCLGHVRRLIGEGAGIIFKGHGFYCTDYKNSPAPSSGEQHQHHTETFPNNDGSGSSAKADTVSSESKKKAETVKD